MSAHPPPVEQNMSVYVLSDHSVDLNKEIGQYGTGTKVVHITWMRVVSYSVEKGARSALYMY